LRCAHAVAQGDENTAPFLYFLPKGRASKKISLRTIRPSLNLIKAAARQTTAEGPAKDYSWDLPRVDATEIQRGVRKLAIALEVELKTLHRSGSRALLR
jgi:hypothetical protein